MSPATAGTGRTQRHVRPASKHASGAETAQPSGMAVLHNRPFLLLWLAQVATQVGGSTVTYGLTILISTRYASASAVGVLLLSFLLPAILFSAIAGVFVDMVDKRQVLVVTNIMRGLAFVAIVFAGDNLLGLYLLMIFVATVTTFFGPAEASMIPFLVPRNQLLAANGLFTLTTNMAFAAGFALAGPLIIALANTQTLILLVAMLYFVAAVFCWTLPASPPAEDSATAERAVAGAERAVKAMVADLSEGITYIRAHHNVGWSLSFLGITGGLVGILAILGPGFAQSALALGEKDFMIVVLPLGMGIVSGIICLNAFGRYVPRRRAIEAGMISMGVLLAILSFAGPISHFLEANVATQIREVSRVASVLSLVIALAFAVGLAFAVVSISSQTQLQEDLPEDVRGRVFGVLNMLVSIASLAPIIIVAPIADIVGRDPVILTVGIMVALIGAISVVRRGPLARTDLATKAGTEAGVPVSAVQRGAAPAELTGGAILAVLSSEDGDEGR